MGIPLRMRCPTIMLGLGTTATQVVCHGAQHIRNELGFIPDVVAYVCLDADAKCPPGHDDHFCAVGVDGAGTSSAHGREQFLTNLRKIADVLTAHFSPLLRRDPRLPTKLTGREATSAHVVASSGGSGGGFEQLAITLLHDTAQRFSIHELRVHVHRITPDVALRDINRTTTREQHQFTHATLAANLGQSFADLAVDQLRQETRQDGTTFSVPTRLLVTSHSLTDRSNGRVDCLTSAETEANLGFALFQRCFTAAGIAHESRICDERRINAMYGFPR